MPADQLESCQTVFPSPVIVKTVVHIAEDRSPIRGEERGYTAADQSVLAFD